MSKLKIKERDTGTTLEAKIIVTSEDAHNFKRLAEGHYKENPRKSELYQISKFKERASFLEYKREKGHPIYKCSKHRIFLHTSQGILKGHIDLRSYLSTTINGERDFVHEFYDYLRTISK